MLICTKFQENIFNSLKVIEWTLLPYESFKGAKFCIKVDRAMVLSLCTLSDDAYICTKCHENILEL